MRTHPVLIMIVEDDEGIREALSLLLEAEGYATLCAENGKKGLALLATSTPELIILDLMMPVMTGMEFLEALKEQGKQGKYPIFVMTAMFGISDELYAMKQRGSITQFVLKPIELSRFLLLLKDIKQLSLSPSESQEQEQEQEEEEALQA